MLEQIKEPHNGHYDEIEGIATVPPPPQDGRGTPRSRSSCRSRH
jgi:hypothetical protein